MRYGLILALIFSFMPFAQANAQDVAERELCQILEEHVPFDDVSYQAGVDVNGNAVVPADLNAPIKPFTNFQIPVTIELAQRLGLNIDALDLETDVGLLEVTDDNRVLFNNQDITSRTFVYCDDPEGTEVIAEDVITRSENIQKEIAEPTGQTAIAPVSSENIEVGSRDEPAVEKDNAPIVGSYGQNTLNTVTNN